MKDPANISQQINALQNLVSEPTIFLDNLDKKFRPDLQKFIIGETLSMQNGKLVIGHNLYKKWLNKIRTKGFDYEIPCVKLLSPLYRPACNR